MTEEAWLPLSAHERAIIQKALTEYAGATRTEIDAIKALADKLRDAKPYPDITVGVYGGVVQWIIGNPFPIRVCDYDGDNERDWPDVDEQGQRCTLGYEQPDSSLQAR